MYEIGDTVIYEDVECTILEATEPVLICPSHNNLINWCVWHAEVEPTTLTVMRMICKQET